MGEQQTLPDKFQTYQEVVTDPKTVRFDFSNIDPQMEIVRFKGRVYELTEPTIKASEQYDDYLISQMRVNKEGDPIQIGRLNRGETLLLQACLRERGVGSQAGQLLEVPLKELEEWPSRVGAPLIEWIKKVGNIGSKKEDSKTDEDQEEDDESQAKKELGTSSNGQENGGKEMFTEEEKKPQNATQDGSG